VLTEGEKVRARHHMGYGGVQQAQTFVLGVPAGVQTAFMIEGALNRLMPQSEGFFRDLLARLDGIEAQILGDQENLAAKKVGTIEINTDEFKQLMSQYIHWQGALANMLQVPPNPFDQRPYCGAGYGSSGGGMNVPVQH
jgi:hypothetical protein